MGENSGMNKIRNDVLKAFISLSIIPTYMQQTPIGEDEVVREMGEDIRGEWHNFIVARRKYLAKAKLIADKKYPVK